MCFLWVLGALAALLQTSDPASEQRTFSAGMERLEHRAPVTPRLLRILAADPGVRAAANGGPVKAEWFLVSEVHILNDWDRYLVVTAAGPLVETDRTQFWVFRVGVDGFDTLLHTSGRTLTVLATRSNYYRDIEVSSAVANQGSKVRYWFNGREYVR